MEWLRTEPTDTEASGAILVDLVGTLPGEVGSLVLRFLDGRELLTCALVGNWAWHALARDHLPWKSLALARTRHKQRAAVHLFHASLLPAAAAVAAPAPATRDNNRSPSAEEADVQGGSDGGAGGGQPRLLPLGSETWEWKEWARAYFGAGREADRARLRSAEELANHSWRFAFRPEAIVTGQTLPTQQFYPQFHADGRYEHHGLFSAPLAWRFIDMPDYDGIEGKRLVQIHRFPALRVRRTADWGWVLENDFVLFESEDPELERKRRKRDQRVKQRIAALSQEELATLSALSEQALCAQLLAWGIEVGNNQGKWSCAEIVAAAVAYIEDVREELRTQEAAKNEELEHARHAHEGYVK